MNVGVELASAVLRRMPTLVAPAKHPELLREAREVAIRLEKIASA